MSTPPPLVSIVVVADGPWDETFRCLQSLHAGAAGVPHEVVVVDDGTRDETAAALPRLPGVTSLRADQPGGWARAAAAGSAAARGRYLAFLHADAEAAPGWLAPLCRLAEADPAVFAVGSRLVTPDGAVEADGLGLVDLGPWALVPAGVHAGERALPGAEVLQVPAVSFVAALVHAEAFRALGGLDEAYRDALEDVDLCLRAAEAGRLTLAAQESMVVHAARCARDLAEVASDLETFNRRWAGAGQALPRPA